MFTVKKLIETFNLKPHPEGGYFCETYRAPGDPCFCTAIYFMLPRGTQSNLHKIKSDELWHFYLGQSLTIVQISPQGEVETICLGPDVLKGEQLQHVVPAGYWFGAFPNPDSDFAFVGCTVAPGFEFQDLTLANRQELIKIFPHLSTWIERLTP